IEMAWRSLLAAASRSAMADSSTGRFRSAGSIRSATRRSATSPRRSACSRMVTCRRSRAPGRRPPRPRQAPRAPPTPRPAAPPSLAAPRVGDPELFLAGVTSVEALADGKLALGGWRLQAELGVAGRWELEHHSLAVLRGTLAAGVRVAPFLDVGASFVTRSY